jgi:AcrR family transcriptional regulator
MRDIARAAGVSKPLLYHYFSSKTELFKAAVAEHAQQLETLLTPSPDRPPIEQLTSTLDAYLEWIDDNARTWSKLMQSATTLPEARTLIDSFRDRTLQQITAGLTASSPPPPALRTALRGWLAYVDAAILDWIDHRDLTRTQLREMLITAFAASLTAAAQADPKFELAIP